MNCSRDANLLLNFFFAILPSLSAYRKFFTASALNRAVYCNKKMQEMTIINNVLLLSEMFRLEATIRTS